MVQIGQLFLNEATTSFDEVFKKYPSGNIPDSEYDKLVENLSIAERIELSRQINEHATHYNRAQILQRYGTANADKVDDQTVIDTIQYDKEMACCAKCNGHKCAKSPYKEMPPSMTITNVGKYRLTHSFTCDKLQKHRREKHLKYVQAESGIPVKYRSKTEYDLKITEGNEDGINLAMSLIAKRPIDLKNLYVVGKCGSGKTMLASIIATKALRDGKSVVFKTVPDMLATLKRQYFGEEYVSTDVLERYRSADLAILDDLGTEQTSNWTREIIYSIINGRYNDEKATIITSNLNGNALCEHIGGVHGERILERILESYKYIELTNISWRRRQAQNQ